MLTKLSFCSLLLALLGACGAHYGIFSPVLGFWICALGVMLMALGLPLGILVWIFRGKESKRPWLLVMLGALSAGAVFYTAGLAVRSPFSDLSTDPKAPPVFETPVSFLDVRGPDGQPDPAFVIPREYDAAQAAEQKRIYPGLGAVLVRAPKEMVFPALEKALKGLPDPWKFVSEDPAKFHLETTVNETIFRFVDDIAIDLRTGGNLTRVEFRSRARWAPHGWGSWASRSTDFGSGVNRITYLRGLVPMVVAPVEEAAKKMPPPAPTASAASPEVVAPAANAPVPQAAPAPAPPTPAAPVAPIATPVTPLPARAPVPAPAAALPSAVKPAPLPSKKP